MSTIEDPSWNVEPLTRRHNRADFTCGNQVLNLYLQRQARQDMDRRLAAVFVLTSDGKSIDGFYTLSKHSIDATDLLLEISRKLPRLPLPTTLLGRMGVARTLQGKGLGQVLLMSALEQALLGSRRVASWAVVVDAKQGARDFYQKNGFIPLPTQSDRLFLPMSTVERLFEKLRS